MRFATRFLAIIAVAITFAGPAMATTVPPLVDAEWVKVHIGEPNVVFLDVRGRLGGHTRADYIEVHIPGAIWTDYLKDGWRTKDENGTIGQLPTRKALEKLIGSLGISNDDHVVIVPVGGKALDVGTATRIYWTFKVLSHDKVSILNGGMMAYLASGNPTASGEETRTPATFEGTFRPELIAAKSDVEAAVAAGRAVIDHRPETQYRGETKHKMAARAGTIPGAKNVPESALTNDGIASFKTSAELKALYAAAGVGDGEEQVNFCNTGHWASLGWFVSSELLGNKKARVYDGSMVEWSADERLPVQSAAN